MIIRTVRVRNFRCIKDETLHCERLTILVGANGSGKSTFLRALDLFYTPHAKYSEEDFYNRETSEPIIITVTFTELTEQEKRQFASHVDGETMTVEKELAWPLGKGSQKYFGSAMRCPDFQQVRTADKVSAKRKAYQDLVNSGSFPELPSLLNNASAEQIEKALQEWEKAHSETLQWVRDEGQFFGFKEVGQAHLERYTRFLYVPAVRDASEDATEGKGSVISELMDLVVRSTLAQRDDVRKLREDTQRRYAEIMNPSQLTELRTLAGRMTKTLDTFAPGAQIQLNWLPGEAIEIPMPKADVKVVEDGYPSAVERTGHGVQRAFILTALQHLALAQAPETRENEAIQQHPSDAPMSGVPPEGNASTPTLPNLILGIEEPELYQHPSRQRHLSRVLSQLATRGIEGVTQNTQIIYTTHSPLLVDLQRFHQIRLLRKEKVEDGKPKQTKVFQATIQEVTQVIKKAHGVAGNYLPEGVHARSQALMTPWTNEGFFANVVVLVEGEDDRAAILGMAKAMGYEFESMDIAVIPCMGKKNLHKAAAIFMALKIPTYVVWDSDEGKKTKSEDNRCLLCLFDAPLEDYPGKVTENFACFKRDMDTTLRQELTPDTYDSLLEQCMGNFGYDDIKQARKNPLVVKTIIEEASKIGKDCTTLKQIVTAVLKLRDSFIHQGVRTNHVSSR